ncbi:Ig domain-containing protein [Trichostrongylus colubriformis]|uniref:Ig domain-containing protein n=1 Tax=Trichostrongylus colubriformis TaxID=6319 RepID=A0AAN8EXP0_TRICO
MILQKYIVYYATRDAADLSEWNKVETDATEIVLQSMSPDTRYLIRVQDATVDGPEIISDAVECYSDGRCELFCSSDPYRGDTVSGVYGRMHTNQSPLLIAVHLLAPSIYQGGARDDEPVEMTLVSVDVPTLEAEPNQTVTFRCTAQKIIFTFPKHFSQPKQDRISEPGDVPANITWMFDENDSLFTNWDRVHFPNGNVTYILYLSNFVGRVAGPPVRIPEVPYSVNITLRVSAKNEWGEGEKSPPITFPTPHGGPRTYRQ